MDSGKSPEVYNVGGAKAKNGGIPDILRSAYRKSFPANQWYQWKAYTPKGCFWGNNPLDINILKWGKPKPKIIWVS